MIVSYAGISRQDLTVDSEDPRCWASAWTSARTPMRPKPRRRRSASASATKATGLLQGGRREGVHVPTWDDGTRSEGQYANGEPSGTWTASYESRSDNLVRAVGPWAYGKRYRVLGLSITRMGTMAEGLISTGSAKALGPDTTSRALDWGRPSSKTRDALAAPGALLVWVPPRPVTPLPHASPILSAAPTRVAQFRALRAVSATRAAVKSSLLSRCYLKPACRR